MSRFSEGDRVRLSAMLISRGDPDGTVIGFTEPDSEGRQWVRVRWDTGQEAQFAEGALVLADEGE